VRCERKVFAAKGNGSCGKREMREKEGWSPGCVSRVVPFFVLQVSARVPVSPPSKSRLQHGPDERVGLGDVDDGPPGKRRERDEERRGGEVFA